MIGMGGTGSGNEDPVLAVMRVLGDPTSYLSKYEDLVKQTIAAKQATEDLIKARSDADALIFKAASDSANLATARAAFEAAASGTKAALVQRENDVLRRETNCAERDIALNRRDAALAKATDLAKADLDARNAKFDAEVSEQNKLLDRRKKSLDDTDAQNQKKIDARAAQLAEREAATDELNRSAAATKLCYEQKISALRAVVGS